MSYDTEHNNDDFQERNFFTGSKPEYNTSKDQVWNEITTKIDSGDNSYTNHKIITPLKTKFFYGIAATLILLLGTGLMMRHYSSSEYCSERQQLSVKLPDGSTVTLQEGSTITYYPLWWSISRKVVLSGEAFFDVVPGNEFIVLSPLGNTSVLGTSFKIVASEKKYIVTCYTGKVKVTSFTEMSVVLKPEHVAEVVYGEIKVSKYKTYKDLLANDSNMFDFESVPFSEVIREIENHFNITITSSTELRYNYTGFFSKNKSIEDVLYILCKPYGLTFVVLSHNKYHIIKN